MDHHNQISKFAAKVRSRLNKFRFFDAVIWSLFVVALILFKICSAYVVKGYAVPKQWFIGAGIAALIGTIAFWITRLWSKREAAHYADDFFDLKDSVGTALAFKDEKREGDFVELQRKATAEKIESAKTEEIKYQRPSRILWAVCFLVLLCTLMGFKKPSLAVQERQSLEAETERRTEETKTAIKGFVEELDKELKDEDNNEIDINKLKEWVDKLEQTKDQKDALRQYAQLERKLQDAAKKLDQRRNEQLLSKAGKEIQKDAENRSLGKKMEDKKFSEAAEDLKKLKPTPIDSKKLSEQRKQLARLKAATKRMSAASKAANRKSSSSSQNSKNMAQNSQPNQDNSKSGKPSKPSSGDQAANSKNSGELDKKIAELAESLSEYEGALEEAELQEAQLSEIDPDLLEEMEDLEDATLADLDELGDLMKMIGKKSDAKNKLLKLSKMVGKCQSGSQQSLAQMMNPGAGQGGKQAGIGSVESRRDQTDPLTDNGNTSQLRGQKGAGTSQSTVEAAADGSGVSNLRNDKKRQIEFSKQIESYVQREDVPDHVKQGVKNYFENIHQSE